MQPGDLGSDSARPNDATRLRLVALELPAGSFRFGGGIGCVQTGATHRSDAAAAIARAVIGPRAADVAGSIDIAGRLVALESLPAPLLKPSAVATIDRMYLDAVWADACARQRADLDAVHAQHRLERHRVEAAIERARQRAEAPEPLPVVPVPPPEPVEDEIATRLDALADALDDLRPVPSPSALARADEFDAYVAAPPAEPEPVAVDLAALERRVAAARTAIAQASGGIAPDARTRIESSHRAVVEAERHVFDAGKKEKPAALAIYNAAVDEERAALALADIDSYASFLMAMTASVMNVDAEARARAERDLAAAQVELTEARSAHLLGRFAGDDPATELRRLRVDHPDAAACRNELRQELAAAGAPLDGDLVATARATAAARRKAVAPPAPRVLSPDPVVADEVIEAEIAALTHERARHERAVADLEAQLADLDVQQSQSIVELDGDAVGLTLMNLLDEYRASNLLAGRLPIVFDGAFDELAAPVLARIAVQLATLDDVQVIVVTASERVVAHLTSVGVPAFGWTAPASEPELEYAPGPAVVAYAPEPIASVTPLPRRGA
jgi:hypothetical protein